ncbi:hypothetical protein [Gordonibacter sp.]|nr:hypothetical protein [Gordonibacter sp.]
MLRKALSPFDTVILAKKQTRPPLYTEKLANEKTSGFNNYLIEQRPGWR